MWCLCGNPPVVWNVLSELPDARGRIAAILAIGLTVALYGLAHLVAGAIAAS